MRLRRIVLGLAAAVIAVLLATALLVVSLHLTSGPSSEWKEFALGPPSGRSTAVNPDGIRADGITLLTAIGVAFEIPAVRIIGPPWLAEQRYSLRATVAPGQTDAFRALLKQELERRLHLETHMERRPFEVFVLSASDRPTLVRSATQDSGAWVGDEQARLRGTDLKAVAAALQNILGKPVVDETGISGWYDLDFAWSGDRLASTTATLADRYGLRLATARRDMNALVVDRVRRETSLVLFSQVGRVSQRMPAAFRRHLAHVLAIR